MGQVSDGIKMRIVDTDLDRQVSRPSRSSLRTSSDDRERPKEGDRKVSNFIGSPTGTTSTEYGPNSSIYAKVGKRLFDISASVTLLLFLMPLFLCLMAIVQLDGGRPFFSHARVGRGGRIFRCHKFRSMVMDARERLAHLLSTDPCAAAEWARDHKLVNDPRVTAVGNILRRSSLDELPQLWNVLMGEMSLVGPRPITEEELRRYGDSAEYYLAVKPGITGLWQVSGRNDIDYEERVRLDVRYSKTISFAGDVMILLRTVLSVVRMTGK